jgi:D-lactate dehydrogenase
MKMHFAETEPSDEEFFRAAFGGHELAFAPDLGKVGLETEILCTYILSRIDGAFLDAHPALKLIVIRASGYDHLDFRVCERREITVCNLPDSNSNTVAEHTFALMLALSRRLLEVREANKQPHFYYEEWRGFDLRDKTLGIIGTGRIGLSVVRIALAFGMKVLGYDPYNHSRMAELLGLHYVPLETLLHESHVVSLHTPLTRETFHLLDREALAKCRPGVIIINTARGAVIDTDALVEALDSGAVAGAGLDVLEEESVMQKEAGQIIRDHIVERLHTAPQEEVRMRDPDWLKRIELMIRNQRLLSRPDVVFTPHIAFNSVEAIDRMREVTVQNIQAFMAGAPINVITDCEPGG